MFFMLQRIHRPLLRSTLFEHLQIEQLTELLHSITYRMLEYRKGEYIYNYHRHWRELGIIIDGKVEVQKHLPSGKKIIMDQLEAGDVFGMEVLFEEREGYAADLMVKRQTEVFFIGEQELLKLFHADQTLLRNYLKYMNRELLFLNQRIECFTNEQTRERVLEYFSHMKTAQNGNGQMTLPYNKSSLADYLGISRASLYRTLRVLETEGCLALRGQKVYFLNDQ